MAILHKTIVKPGKYLVRTLSGDRAVRKLSKTDLARAAKTGNEMIKAGILIPVPYGHSDGTNAVPVPVTRDLDDPTILLDAKTGKPARWDHALNSGFIQRFEVGADGSLDGYIDAEGDVNDEKTHAGRLGKMFKQVSPLLLGEWVDGKGNLREMAPLHVAVTNKGVEFGQQNFRAMPEDQELSIAMSFSDDDLIALSTDEDGSEPEKVDPNAKAIETDSNKSTVETDKTSQPEMGPEIVNKVRTELKLKLNVTLPDDTDATNFLDRLLTILTNLEAKEEEEGEFDVEPEDGKPPKSPTIMSLDELETKKLNGALGNIAAKRREEFKARIERAVSKGRTGRAHADKKLLPLVEGFAMSLDDMDEEGNFKASAIEMALDALEDAEALVGEEADGNAPADGYKPGQPDDMRSPGDGEVDQKDVDEILDQVFPNSPFGRVRTTL
jgi:hypothetical protein